MLKVADIRARLDDERGIAMITVVVIGTILFLLAAVMAARSISSLNQVVVQRSWERALHVAESGIHRTLYELVNDQTYNTGEIVPPSFASDQAEEDWVREEAEDNAVVSTPQGQYQVVKPSNETVAYAVGFVPDSTDPSATRVIRTEYDYAPFRMRNMAILSDGDLSIPGNPVIAGTGGSVHSNQNVTMSGSPTIAGTATATGSYTVTGVPIIGDPTNSGGGRPPLFVPMINPRENYELSEYDLCPDGNVRTGPAYPGPEPPNMTDTPCQGTLLADADSIPYRGWKKTGDDASDGAKWDFGGNTAYDGVYYVYQGSAVIGGNPGAIGTEWSVTVMAEASATGPEPSHCPHVGGDIEVGGNPKMRFNDGAAPLLFVAGRDLRISGNPDQTHEGFLAAHEQFNISGNPVLNAALIANDRCDSPSSAVAQTDHEISGNPLITYNGQWEAPIGTNIRITLWLEL
jgi:hypothetical protein